MRSLSLLFCIVSDTEKLFDVLLRSLLVMSSGKQNPQSMFEKLNGKDDLEKRIYRSALTETVKDMNKSMDDAQRRNTPKDEPCKSAEPRTKKKTKRSTKKSDIMLSDPKKATNAGHDGRVFDKEMSGAKTSTGGKKGIADNHGLLPCKQQRNALKKTGWIKKAETSVNQEKELNRDEKAPGKLSRKDRRLEKEKTRGKGMSSKEYYEKFIKKSNKIQEKTEKDILPSKRKEDYPRSKEDGIKKKKSMHSFSSRRSRK